MFRNLTIGKKIGYGFSFVLLCLAAVGVMSYIGVGGIVTNASEVIVGNQLDGTLAQKEVDHLNWANQVGALLTDDAVTKLNVQTDDHQCEFGKWLYGEERRLAEATVPEIAPLLKEIEACHTELHNSAIAIGEQYRPADALLPGTLATFIVDELTWCQQIQNVFADNLPELAINTVADESSFGKWLNSEQVKQAAEADPTFAKHLEACRVPHLRMFESANKIAEQYRQIHPGLAEELGTYMQELLTWVGTCGQNLAIESGSMHSYCTRIQPAVDQAIALFQACDADESIGDVQARQARAKELVKNLRFGAESKDYLWINDMHPTMVMHPIKPKLDGQDLSGFEDPNGKKLFVEMANVCKSSGSGYVVYYWPKPGSENPVPKISYVAVYEPWGWIVGTGVYMREDDQSLIKRAEELAAGIPFNLGVETNPADTGLGKFLDDPRTVELCSVFPALKASLDACRDPHQRLYASAAQIDEFVRAGNLEEATLVFRRQTLPALEELKQEFSKAIAAETSLVASWRSAESIYYEETIPALNELRKALEDSREYATSALEGIKQANRVFATQTKPNLRKAQELLGKIRATIKQQVITDEAMLTAAQTTKRNVTMVGAVAIIIGFLLAFFISRGIIGTLTKVITGLNEGADQVNDAATQVSSASQQLAEGASEQASSLEETSSALEEVAAQTRTNAENSNTANDLAAQARNNAEDGDKTMSQLNTAMAAINESSNEISKIIKVIEEIAFQTNLLALNAAVEAARAGEHGKGFAVVAEEVRNLAQRSAQAARDTTALIEGSVTRAKEGSTVAANAGTALQAIVSDVAQVAELLNGITQASQEQAQGVDQVNTAVTQMDKVTQQNAAGAEESASAAEQLSAQAQCVKGMVDELATMVGASKSTTEHSTPIEKNTRPVGFGAGVESQQSDQYSSDGSGPVNSYSNIAPHSSSDLEEF